MPPTTQINLGLIGMWKAFHELKELGWVDGPFPKMVAVQAEGCAPIVKAWEAGESGLSSFIVTKYFITRGERSLQEVKGD